MKILLTAVNAKYIHSNLAVYSLMAYAKDQDVEAAEYTINQQKEDVLMDIYKRKPDVLCFSCYIWNIDYIEELIGDLALLRRDMQVWLGGPEVSYDAAEVLTRLGSVKGVMKGEGEATFAKLCRIYQGDAGRDTGIDDELATLDGIAFRDEAGVIRENPWRGAMDLSEVPFVNKVFEHKIIYYESSRGCPFSCSYCLSSIDKRLRFRDLDLVRRELRFFIDNEVPQVKFVDRTFNCKHDHAIAIWRYIAKYDRGMTNFHFEIAADLLNEEEMQILEGMRPGLVQLEIGVQSTNPDTLRAICRTMDLAKVKRNVRRIKRNGNIHQHLDLIAGLPYEDIDSFARSFDEVYELKPEQLQLGFLKVLKGSRMEEKRQEYGLVCKGHPPYEVLYTRWLSYEDIMRLKGIEEMVEVYYNSGQFAHTLDALEEEYASAFAMYDELYRFYEEQGYGKVQHRRSMRYEILLQYISVKHMGKEEKFRELLTYDYYLRENAKTRPEFAGEYRVSKEVLRVFYENEEEKRRYLPAYEGFDRNQMRKMTHIEYFPLSETYILFDYRERDALNQDARVCTVEL